MSIRDRNLPELYAALEQKRTELRVREEATLYSRGLRGFIEAAWPLVEPVTPFVSNWHIDAICDHLEAASRGEILRLLINIPPRHMKSLAVSVFWPAWWWTFAPHKRFLTASYGASLAERDAVRSRDLIRSAWYQERWPHLQLKADANRTNRYENTATGYRLATSVGGEGTGEGGDVIIIDDPHKAEEALTAAGRARVSDWHDGTLGFRFNDPKRGIEVVVMQRLHELDLTGHLLERSGWTHLCLPARYEPRHPFCWPGDPRRDEGELLWPAHVPEPELARIEETMGSYRAAGQLQQRPAALEGELLKRRWWNFYDPALLNDEQIQQLPRFRWIVQSWDTAFKDTTSSDYVVGQVWGLHGADRYLLRSFRQRANLQATKDAMRASHAWVERHWKRRPHTLLIEKSANGPEIISELKRELSGVTAINPNKDKFTRAMAASPALEAGNIFLPGRAAPDTAAGYHAAEWVESLIEECANFPNGRHDDQVDAFSQAINWARGRGTSGMRSSVPTGRIDLEPGLGLDRAHPVAAGGRSRIPLYTGSDDLATIAAQLGIQATSTYAHAARRPGQTRRC
jgi:predicted phage terminase large subunit-like protein